MGFFTEEMGRLAEDIHHARTARLDFISQNKVNVKTFLTQSWEKRSRQAAQEAAARRDFISQIVQTIDSFLSGTREALKKAQQEFRKNAADLRAQLNQERLNTTKDEAQARTIEIQKCLTLTRTFLEDSQNQRSKAAQQDARLRREFIADIAHKVEKYLKSSRQDVTNAERTRQQEFNRIKDGLVRLVTELKHGSGRSHKRKINEPDEQPIAKPPEQELDICGGILHSAPQEVDRPSEETQQKSKASEAIDGPPDTDLGGILHSASQEVDGPSEETQQKSKASEAIDGLPDIDLGELDLPERIMTVLAENDINSLNQIMEMTEQHLLDISGIGKSSVQEIQWVLSERGFSLKESS